MGSAIQDLEVSIQGCCLVTRNVNPATPNVTEIYALTNISRVVPVTNLGFGTRQPDNNRKHRGALYDDKLVIEVFFVDKSPELTIDIQRVSNQVGWTSDTAGVQQAVDDICLWITSCSAAAGAVGLATEATLAAYTALFAGTEIPGSQDLAGNLLVLPTNTYYSVTIVIEAGTATFDGETYNPGVYSFSANAFKKLTAMTINGALTVTGKILTTQ